MKKKIICPKCKHKFEIKEKSSKEMKYEKYLEYASWIMGGIVIALAFYGMLTTK